MKNVKISDQEKAAWHKEREAASYSLHETCGWLDCTIETVQFLTMSGALRMWLVKVSPIEGKGGWEFRLVKEDVDKLRESDFAK